MQDAEDVLTAAQAWLAEGREVTWATVVSTWRSSPRPVGSQMMIADDGRFAGSVSGGCVEAAVIDASRGVLASGSARLLAYGVSTETAWDVGLPCGGKLEVLLAPLPADTARELLEARRSRAPAVIVRDLSTGARVAWDPGRSSAEMAVGGALHRAIAEVVARGASCGVEVDGRRLFVQILGVPLRLVVVGAVHLTQALGALAELSGYELTVIDPRTAFATAERFPRAALVHDWPAEALASLAPDRDTAIVVLSHDAKLDEPALEAALRSDAFYIGALGSRRTQESRRRRLRSAGFDDAALARIHGPVGLDIGAVTAPEMAIAIMAEIIQARRGPRRADAPAPAAEGR